MGMAFKINAKQIPNFSLIPVGCRPDGGYARKGRGLSAQGNLDPNILIPGK
jgi:hypothetical protein